MFKDISKVAIGVEIYILVDYVFVFVSYEVGIKYSYTHTKLSGLVKL